jgi:hypothetical protein
MSLYQQYIKFGSTVCTFNAYRAYKKEYQENVKKSLIELQMRNNQKELMMKKIKENTPKIIV